MKKGDPVFIRATYAPIVGELEGNMVRVVTASEGTEIFVSKQELIIPDRCDGNSGDDSNVRESQRLPEPL